MSGLPNPTHRWAAVASCAAGVALFSCMDVLMKHLSIEIGAYSALIWRSMVASTVSGGIMLGSRGTWPTPAVLRLHILRGVIIAGMAWLFFWALARLPLAEAIALSFIAPIIALFLAALMLGERIRPSAILAALLGLVGTAIILSGRLSGAYDSNALWGAAAVLVSAVLFAWNLILQRRQAQVARPVEISFFQSIIVLCTLLPAAPFLLQPAAPVDWIAIATAAILAISSQMCLSWAYARAQAQTLIPLEYSAFFWGALFGWLVFAEPLTLPTLLGTALIIFGCLLIARDSPAAGPRLENEVA
ncbi:DMT family transporter [Sphingobium subterraneum]|uniref:S-adenosylmethionine uptake transporter n=1 Tax=Sphingobium subterraneum TaxID=627688 RepID=A0A841J0N5_9SPHN|nr:DMT family transporter [Sphingobium subterraneum]MBB6124407.1 S-adenosylmethionine uptake transporter [Sphingobium subterraneum]